MMAYLVLALEYLYYGNFVYRDAKLSNVLAFPYGYIKLAILNL